MKTKNLSSSLLLILIVIFSHSAVSAKQVTISIASAADYPWVCHKGYADSPLGRQYIEGKMIRLYFGYTRLNTDEYLQTTNPAWYNYRGEARAEGYVDLHYTHDGGYKGIYNLDPVTVEVPEGWNLLYRIAYLRRTNGGCYSAPDQVSTTYEESAVYFKETGN